MEITQTIGRSLPFCCYRSESGLVFPLDLGDGLFLRFFPLSFRLSQSVLSLGQSLLLLGDFAGFFFGLGLSLSFFLRIRLLLSRGRGIAIARFRRRGHICPPNCEAQAKQRQYGKHVVHAQNIAFPVPNFKAAKCKVMQRNPVYWGFHWTKLQPSPN